MFKRGKKQPDREQLLSLLTQWFASEMGSQLLSKQREHLDEALTRCFGYHLLQLSADADLNLFNECRVQKKYRVHPFSKGCSAHCHFDELPFANESLDVVIVHHVHEFVENPHQMLREMQRVVVPHGHLIIVGFNPWSLQGVYTGLAGLMSGSMWQNKLITSRRMKDWLSLLGFEINKVEYGFHNPQYLERRVGQWGKEKLRAWPLGNFYMVSAIKQVSTMTPVKLRWSKPRKKFAGLSPAEPRVAKLIPKKPFKEDVA
jgi:SAM-dependent methyltransferase